MILICHAEGQLELENQGLRTGIWWWNCWSNIVCEKF